MNTEGQSLSRERQDRTFSEWPGTDDSAFDLWLRTTLREAFDAMIAEPVPEDILRMIEEDRSERECVRDSRRAKRG
jgi:hypothetical protein